MYKCVYNRLLWRAQLMKYRAFNLTITNWSPTNHVSLLETASVKTSAKFDLRTASSRCAKSCDYTTSLLTLYPVNAWRQQIVGKYWVSCVALGRMRRHDLLSRPFACQINFYSHLSVLIDPFKRLTKIASDLRVFLWELQVRVTYSSHRACVVWGGK